VAGSRTATKLPIPTRRLSKRRAFQTFLAEAFFGRHPTRTPTKTACPAEKQWAFPLGRINMNVQYQVSAG
jgi:hypothetical protein